MTIVGERPVTAAHRADATQRLRLAPSRRPRNVPWIVVGLLLVAGGALAFGVLATRLGNRQPVLVVARAVPAGQVIRSADVRVVGIAVDGDVSGIPASARAQVVGKPATHDLGAGALLTRDDIGTGRGLAAGKAIVGLGLKASQVPAQDLGPGARVVLLDTGDPTSVSRAGPTILGSGRVTSVKRDDSAGGAGTVAVSVVVDRDVAPAVAAVNASGRIAVVVEAP